MHFVAVFIGTVLLLGVLGYVFAAIGGLCRLLSMKYGVLCLLIGIFAASYIIQSIH